MSLVTRRVCASLLASDLARWLREPASRLPGYPSPPKTINRLSFFFLSFTAVNSLAGAAMTLGMIASDVVCEKNHKICYLDSAAAILIAIALFSYGVL